MRICMLNWPMVFDGARKGGIAGYTQALALELAARGHRVSTVASGTTYVPARRGRPRPGPCAARRHADWFGIGVYEVVNSPVLAPSLLQLNGPRAEVASGELERVFERVLGEIAPEVLHVQSMEGFSLGCLDVARRLGCRVVYSLHNYHPLCPQVYLMRGHRTLCADYDGGRACAGCVPAPDPDAERGRRAAAHPDEPPPFEAPAAEPGRVRLPVLPVELGATPPVVGPAEDERGTSALLRSWREPRRWCIPEDETWRPFDNVPRAEPLHKGEPTEYSTRRGAFIDQLNRCDAVHAVSSFVAGKFVAHGVEASRVRTLTIGTIANELREHNAELAFDPPPRPTADARPLRLVFVGVNHWYKGLSMLADSLEMLTPDTLGGVALSVFAAGGKTIEYRFRRLEPRLASLRYGYEYGPQDLPWMCGGMDVGVVPSVWWDNGPQTVLEMQASGLPVIGARAGGIPDFVEDGVNGLLFPGNDRFALAAAIARCVHEPSLAPKLRAGVRPPKSMSAHALEMERLYLERGGTGGVS